MFSFLFSLVIGALAGFVASRIMNSESSTWRNIVSVSYTHLGAGSGRLLHGHGVAAVHSRIDDRVDIVDQALACLLYTSRCV